MKRQFKAAITQEGEWFIAQCLEVDVVSQGESEEEALANLGDALQLYFQDPVATVDSRIRTIEVDVGAP